MEQLKNRMINKIKDFMEDGKTLEIFGQLTSEDISNYYRIVKYKKEDSLYIKAFYDTKSIELFDKTDVVLKSFKEFINSLY